MHQSSLWLLKLNNYFGLKTLEKSYLFKVGGRIVERPQYLFMRVALGIHGNNIKDAISVSDLVIGAVYVIGKEAPKVITLDMLKGMKPGTVMVDISIDQGGCFESSKPTTHDKPTFLVDGVLHYCVTNMPGCVPRTSTISLNQATLPFVKKLARDGLKKALSDDRNFMNGLNVIKNKCTQADVARDLNIAFSNPEDLVA